MLNLFQHTALKILKQVQDNDRTNKLNKLKINGYISILFRSNLKHHLLTDGYLFEESNSQCFILDFNLFYFYSSLRITKCTVFSGRKFYSLHGRHNGSIFIRADVVES